MRKEDLYRAIGELDEKLLAKSEAGWRPSRVFRTALTAAACLLLAVGIGSAMWLGRGGAPETWETPMASVSEEGLEWNLCDMILDEGKLCFSTFYVDMESGETTNARVYGYDPAENSTVRLGDFPAAFTRAQSGNYCTDRSTGDVYALGGGNLTKVGSIPEYDEWTHELLGVTDDTLLYSVEVFRDGYFFDIYELNLTDQTTRTLYSNDNSDVLLTTCYLRDGVLYYERSVVMGETGYYAMDIHTGESEQMNIVPPSGKESRYLTFFDDAIYLIAYPEDVVDPTAHGAEDAELCKVDYDTLELTSLTQTGLGFDIQRDGQKLYWELPTYNDDGSMEVRRIYEYNLEAASVTRTIELPASTSLSVYCADGCYYDDSREDHPGIFFYNAATGETVRIDPAKTAADSGQINSSVQDEIIWDEYNTLLSDNTLYFSAYAYAPGTATISNAGVFCYNPVDKSPLRLGDIPAVFTQAQSGDYCTDITTGDVYELDGNAMTQVGTLPLTEDQPELTLIDVLGDTIYYYGRIDGGFALYALDTQRGNTRELYRREETGYEIQGAYIRDWKLYYWTLYHTADPEIFALDLNTGERRKLDFFPSRPLYRFDNIAFYEDGIFVSAAFYDVSGCTCCWLDYETQESKQLFFPTRLEEYAIGPITRDGDTFYWREKEWPGNSAYRIVECDMRTDTVTRWEETVPLETNDLRAYADGYYYTQIEGGIYYYDRSTARTERIDVSDAAGVGTVVKGEPEASQNEALYPLGKEMDE